MNATVASMATIYKVVTISPIVNTTIIFECDNNRFYDGRTNLTLICGTSGRWNIPDGIVQRSNEDDRMNMILKGCICRCFISKHLNFYVS